MSRSRGPDRESSTDGAPERAEEADYDAPSSDAGGAAEHAAAPQLDSGMVCATVSGSESPELCNQSTDVGWVGAIDATEHVLEGASEHVPRYAETVVESMRSTMLVPWDDIESSARVMRNIYAWASPVHSEYVRNIND